MPDPSVVHVHIFGTEYRIASVSDPEHTRKVARYVDRKMRELANSLSLRSVTRIAVLTALNLADELIREEDVGQRIDQAVGDKADRLAASINRVKWGG